MRGISLEQIVATTKIGTRLLRALEDEQFDLLPGGIFNKSYVRAYAKCVGLDEDEAVALYLEAANESPPDTRVIAQQHASIHSDRLPERTGFPIVPVLVFLLVIAGGVGGWKAYQDRLRDRALPVAAATSATPASPPSNGIAPSDSSVAAKGNATPVQSTGAATSANAQPKPAGAAAAPKPSSTTSASPGGAAVAGSFEVVIRPKDSAWVSVKSDGNVVVRGIIRPPDVKTIRASDQIVFFTGNAGAVEVSFNGKNVPLAGGPNEEQTLIFNSRGPMPQTTAP